MTNIFGDKKKDEEDFLIISPVNHKGYWVFEYNKKYYNIAPSHSTQLSLSPLILGIDKIMIGACHYKNINIDKGFYIKLSKNYFDNCDVSLNYIDTLFDGWVYGITPQLFSNVREHQKIWMCPYLKFYYNNPPASLYVEVEKK